MCVYKNVCLERGFMFVHFAGGVSDIANPQLARQPNNATAFIYILVAAQTHIHTILSITFL